jgi:hypothetical protein
MRECARQDKERAASRAVDVRSMRDIKHDDGLGLLIDAIADAPLLATASGVLARVFVVERVTDAVRVVQQGADDELGGSRGDLLRCCASFDINTGGHSRWI